MPYRDEYGHFISEAEARDRGLIPGEVEPKEVEPNEGEVLHAPTGWVDQTLRLAESVFIETGRGQTAEVQVGAPFQPTIERIAEEVHYGGYFRVFLNGEEIINPEEAPATIEPGMRIALTSYKNRGCVPGNSGKAEMLILSQVGA